MEEAAGIILEGIHYSSQKLIRLEIRDGKIYSISETGEHAPDSEKSPGQLPTIAPGLVDIQINGMKGVDFNDPELTAGQVESILPDLLQEGLTSFFPTLITGPAHRTSYLLKTFADLSRGSKLAAAMLGGIHLEGPFISKEDGPRGAHPLEYCLDPDISLVRRWQQEADGLIKIITLAPELPGSEELIRACVDLGMVVAIGHTAANTDEIRTAVDAGASLSTHLGNGCHPMLPRHPNYIWDQLASDELYVSMIADGFHLPDSVLKVYQKLKQEKAILVSDGMSFTGMDAGLYESPSTGRVCLTEDGKLHRQGNPQLLAGSAGTLIRGVKKMSSLIGLAKAWDMASVNPMRIMNQPGTDGLKAGAPADLLLLETSAERLKIKSVYKQGILSKG